MLVNLDPGVQYSDPLYFDTFGLEILKPNHLKSGQMVAILSNTIWFLDKKTSRFWMVGTKAMAIARPFENKSFKSLWT